MGREWEARSIANLAKNGIDQLEIGHKLYTAFSDSTDRLRDAKLMIVYYTNLHTQNHLHAAWHILAAPVPVVYYRQRE